MKNKTLVDMIFSSLLLTLSPTVGTGQGNLTVANWKVTSGLGTSGCRATDYRSPLDCIVKCVQSQHPMVKLINKKQCLCCRRSGRDSRYRIKEPFVLYTNTNEKGTVLLPNVADQEVTLLMKALLFKAQSLKSSLENRTSIQRNVDFKKRSRFRSMSTKPDVVHKNTQFQILHDQNGSAQSISKTLPKVGMKDRRSRALNTKQKVVNKYPNFRILQDQTGSAESITKTHRKVGTKSLRSPVMNTEDIPRHDSSEMKQRGGKKESMKTTTNTHENVGTRSRKSYTSIDSSQKTFNKDAKSRGERRLSSSRTQSNRYDETSLKNRPSRPSEIHKNINYPQCTSVWKPLCPAKENWNRCQPGYIILVGKKNSPSLLGILEKKFFRNVSVNTELKPLLHSCTCAFFTFRIRNGHVMIRQLCLNPSKKGKIKRITPGRVQFVTFDTKHNMLIFSTRRREGEYGLITVPLDRSEPLKRRFKIRKGHVTALHADAQYNRIYVAKDTAILYFRYTESSSGLNIELFGTLLEKVKVPIGSVFDPTTGNMIWCSGELIFYRNLIIKTDAIRKFHIQGVCKSLCVSNRKLYILLDTVKEQYIETRLQSERAKLISTVAVKDLWTQLTSLQNVFC